MGHGLTKAKEERQAVEYVLEEVEREMVEPMVIPALLDAFGVSW